MMEQSNYDYTLENQSAYFKKTIMLNLNFLDGLVLREELTEVEGRELKEFNQELLECLNDILDDYSN